MQLSTSTLAGVNAALIPVQPGSQITFGGWVYVQSGSAGAIGWWLAVYDANKTPITFTGPASATSAAWTFQSTTYTVPSNAAYAQVYVQIYQPTGTTVARFDDGFLNIGARFFHPDHLSNRLVTDASGNTIEQLGHFPYGESWYNSTGDKLLFTSYERDTESGNDYAMARMYVNRLGRFSAVDPLSGSADNPQSLNHYSYVLNNPENFVDPSGLHTECTSVTVDGVRGPEQCIEVPDPPPAKMPDQFVNGWPDWLPDGSYPPIGSNVFVYYTVAEWDDIHGSSSGSSSGGGGANNQNVAKSVTSKCLAEYNGSTAAKGVQFFSLYHLATDLRNAWAEWTLLPAGKYALAKTASWISGQIGTTEFLSVTGATSSTVIPSTTTAVVDLAETAGKAGAAPAIITGTGLDVLANAGCATVGRQAAGHMTPLPPGWASSF